MFGVVGLGVTAFISGALMLLDPSGSMMGLEVTWLDRTPFQDYSIPGLILFSVLGIGSFVVLYAIRHHRPWAWGIAIGLAIALIGWVTTQVLLLRMYHILQLIYGGLGITLLGLALLPSVRAHLKP